MPHHTAVLCLLLMAGTLAAMGAGEDKYTRRENGAFTNTPSTTVPAMSDTACAISCSTMEPWFCGGFTYHSGACDLYRETAACVGPLEVVPSLEVDTGSEPRSYRRLQPTGPGEGILTCFFQI